MPQTPITIDRDVPRPTTPKYPFAAMQMGDSFATSAKSRAGLYSLAKRCGIKVVIHAEGEHQVRVWRVA